jgi:hypothetical protein
MTPGSGWSRRQPFGLFAPVVVAAQGAGVARTDIPLNWGNRSKAVSSTPRGECSRVAGQALFAAVTPQMRIFQKEISARSRAARPSPMRPAPYGWPTASYGLAPTAGPGTSSAGTGQCERSSPGDLTQQPRRGPRPAASVAKTAPSWRDSRILRYAGRFHFAASHSRSARSLARACRSRANSASVLVRTSV